MAKRALFLLALALDACGEDAGRAAAPEPSASAGAPSESDVDALLRAAPSAVVSPGESIQSAIDAVAPGSIIVIRPGIYREALVVTTPRIALLGISSPGAGSVVIENPGGEADGVFVGDAGDGFALVNVTVRGFGENGVLLVGVRGFILARVRAEDNGEYGLFPVLSSDGLITGCSAVGHADAGIYVGQSARVAVTRNAAERNVSGFEIENSSDVLVFRNEASDNTAGMLVVLLPGLDVKASTGVGVIGNRVRENDRPNFAAPGELAAAVPAGSGILVIGVDQVTVSKNTVTGNDQLGIAVGSTLLLGQLAGLPPEAFADIEPNPDGVRVIRNSVLGNGSAPPQPALPAVDLFWDGSGTGNCWQANVFGTNEPDALPACLKE